MEQPLLASLDACPELYLVCKDQMKGINTTPKIRPKRYCPLPDRLVGNQTGFLLLLMSMSPFSCLCYGFRSKELSTQNRAEWVYKCSGEAGLGDLPWQFPETKTKVTCPLLLGWTSQAFMPCRGPARRLKQGGETTRKTSMVIGQGILHVRNTLS